MIEPQIDPVKRALDCLNHKLGRQFALSERLAEKSCTWAVAALDGQRGVLKVYDDSDYATV